MGDITVLNGGAERVLVESTAGVNLVLHYTQTE